MQNGRELEALRNELVDELAGETDPGRRQELMAKLVEAGVSVASRVAVKPPGPPPRGCIRGSDGIIRSKPGVFEKRYRAEVLRRSQSEERYRSEAMALLRLGRTTRVHVPTRAPAGRRPAGRRPRVRRCAHSPPREPDDPDLANLAAESR